jgi:type VI secretion system VasD/TssJ family lipoprotein
MIACSKFKVQNTKKNYTNKVNINIISYKKINLNNKQESCPLTLSLLFLQDQQELQRCASQTLLTDPLQCFKNSLEKIEEIEVLGDKKYKLYFEASASTKYIVIVANYQNRLDFGWKIDYLIKPKMVNIINIFAHEYGIDVINNKKLRREHS